VGVSLATPKSTRERIHRRTRVRVIRLTNNHMLGRVVPKKTGNNDPDHGGNRIHNKPKELEKAMLEAIEDWLCYK
jgi:hypothetical protein